jgi:pimeloyl-ACP methyl ester carboxylesterase
MDRDAPEWLLLKPSWDGREMILKAVAAFSALATAATAVAASPSCSAVDPPRNAAHPAHNKQLLIPSGGVGMNALLFAAAGAGPHRTVVLMHGLPGNERNLDLAQAIRRCGWDVLTFTYRGAWGSPGDFSISNAMEDTAAALAFARSPDAARLGIDPKHIVLAGHSMGGATAFMTAAGATGLDGLILLDAANLAASASRQRAQLVAGLDDFGNSLHGATPETVADEILSRGPGWNSIAAASKLRGLPVLNIAASEALGPMNRPVNDALRRSGAQLTAIELRTDHAFTDHRMELAATVTGWLQRLWVRR